MVERGVTLPLYLSPLSTALPLPHAPCVAFIGAGGKTTAMLALAGELAGQSRKVIVTTTTKIWKPGVMSTILWGEWEDPGAAVRAVLQSESMVAIGRSIDSGGKLLGISSREVCTLARSAVADAILIEADGAAGRSLKIHGSDEPVIPDCTTTVIVVAGIDSVGRNTDERTIHRMAEIRRIAPDEPPAVVDPPLLARALLLACTHVHAGAQTVVALNKVDSEGAQELALEVANLVRAMRPGIPVILLHRGQVVSKLGDPLAADSRAGRR